ncbi:MAG: DUF4129 domain-containing protein [Anaerolineaceae bacterium]|nr:DUF4129 domain-containing protein [Anaerolineaceae bacterium]MCB9098542.1 DUF4129 domain-containing protein [Anaerolineales bacterium]
MLPAKGLTSRKKIYALLLALAAGAATLLAGSLGSVEFLPGEPLPLGALIESLQRKQLVFSGIPLPGGLWYLLAAGLWALLIISLIAFVISPEIRKETIKRVIRYTIIMLLLHGLIRLLPPFPTPEETAKDPEGVNLLDKVASEPLPSPPEFVVNPPDWLIGGVSLALFAVLLIVVWLFWQRFFKPKPSPTPLELLTLEAEHSLGDLQAGADLKDTIMHCYRQMNRILSDAQDLERQRSMTPREFEQYLSASGLDDAHIQRLTRLFERVRYSSTRPSAAEETEAAACLTAIVQAYGAPS